MARKDHYKSCTVVMVMALVPVKAVLEMVQQVACNMSGRVTGHLPEDKRSQW